MNCGSRLIGSLPERPSICPTWLLSMTVEGGLCERFPELRIPTEATEISEIPYFRQPLLELK